MTQIERKTLRNGVTVLAKTYKDLLLPVGYANRTQAENKAAQLKAAGISCDVRHWGRPFHVAITCQHLDFADTLSGRKCLACGLETL